ncbi:MAG: protein kinase [Blastocatellia bacterium]|nr:protein kinase [Blastocatellia bacterium]
MNVRFLPRHYRVTFGKGWVCWLWVVLCLLTIPTGAQTGPVLEGRPAFRVFSDRDGLPQNSVFCSARDQRGYLWVGTQDGVAVYNGRTWTPLPLPQRATSSYIVHLLAASDGSLWMASAGSGVLRYDQGNWTIYDQTTGFFSNRAQRLLEIKDSQGNSQILVGTTKELACFTAGKWTHFDHANSPLPGDSVNVLLESQTVDNGRALWIGTRDAGLARVRLAAEGVTSREFMAPSAWEVFTPANSGLPGKEIRSGLETVEADGRTALWIGTKQGAAKLKDGQWSTFTTKNSRLPHDWVAALAETHSPNGEKTVWLATNGGGLVAVTGNNWRCWTVTNGFPTDTLASLLAEDTSAGSIRLWVGTDGKGLVRLDLGKWATVDKATGAPIQEVMCLLETKAATGNPVYWIGGTGGVGRWEAGTWTILNSHNGLPVDSVYALSEGFTETGESILWIGTYGGGVVGLRGTERLLFDTKTGLPSNAVHCLLATFDTDGKPVLWVGTDGEGLACFKDGKWTTAKDNPAFPKEKVYCIRESRARNGKVLWVTTNEGLYVREGEIWRHIRKADGLPSEFTISVQPTPVADGRTLVLVGTLGSGMLWGIYESDNQKIIWHTLNDQTQPAIPNNTVYQIRQTPNHDNNPTFFGSTNRGAFRLVAKNAMPQHPADWHLTAYNDGDGLPGNEANSGASMVDSQGRIWFGTLNGAALFDPRREVPNPVDAPIQIEQTLVNNVPVTLNRPLVYHENTVTFAFALLDFSGSPNFSFQTQLVGLESAPAPWTTDNKARYTNLGAGTYVFKVWARNPDGAVTGPVEATFSVKPAPWRTGWAYALYLIAATGLGYSGVRWRFRQLELRTLELEAKVAERTAELAQNMVALEQANHETERKNKELAQKNSELIASQQRADRIFSALAEALPGTVLDDKYRLDQKIGSGGFGVVFRGTHLGLNRPIAIKVFRPTQGNDTTEAVERFRREGISASRVNHPNAIQVLDSGISAEGIAYLVMELLVGHSLTAELRFRHKLTLNRTVEIITPVCSALAEAHRQGLIHRDIKPDNIFLHRTAEGEVVKVLDFGIAKLVGEETGPDNLRLTATGGIIGTPMYMSPERLSNAPYGEKSDVYSLGIVLYECLTGQTPFEGFADGIGSLILAHLRMPPPPLTDLIPGLPEDVQHVILRALSKNPDERPTATELADGFALAVARYTGPLKPHTAATSLPLVPTSDIEYQPTALTPQVVSEVAPTIAASLPTDEAAALTLRVLPVDAGESIPPTLEDRRTH